MDNDKRYYLRGTATSVATLALNSGVLFQAFLQSRHVPTSQIGAYVSVTGIAQAASMLLCAGLVDRIADVRRASALLYLPNILFIAAMLPLSLIHSASPLLVFWMAVCFSAVTRLAAGVRDMLDYRLPYLIIPISDYARLTSTDGAIAGFAGIAVSAGISAALRRFDSAPVMSAMFIAALLLFLFAAWETNRFQVLPDAPKPNPVRKDQTSLRQMMRMPSFYLLILPNLLRGCSTGVMAMAAILGVEALGLSAEATAAASAVTTAGSVAGSMLYAFLARRRLRTRNACAFGSLLMLVSAPLMLAGRIYPLFLVMLFLANVGILVVNYAVPVMVTEFVPYDVVGRYTALRMSLTTGGSAFASFLLGKLAGSVSPVLLLSFAGTLQALSGAVYWWFSKHQDKMPVQT